MSLSMRRFADPGSRSPQNTARGMLLIAASFTLAVVVGCDNGSFLRRDAATGIGDLRLFCVPIEYKGENEVYGWPRCEP